MVGQAREPERDTTIHNRPEKSPTRSSNQYRERSRDGSIRIPDKKKSKKSDEEEESMKEKESEERGRCRSCKSDKPAPQPQQSIADMNNEDMMIKMMGFGSFDSTKGKHVDGVAGAVAKKNKSTKYRQYMNREKGFNRALSPDRKR